MKICACFGHRKIEPNRDLHRELEIMYKKIILEWKIYTFYFGGYGEFDELCYEVLSKLKQKWKQLKLVYVRPYYEFLSQSIIDLYKKQYDDCIYLKPKNKYPKYAILFRNYAIVDASNLVIFYVDENRNGGAKKVFDYTKRKSKNFINLYKNPPKSKEG